MLNRDEIEQLAQLYAEQLGVDPAQFINQLKSRYGQNYEQLASMSANDIVEALGAIDATQPVTPAATATAQAPAASTDPTSTTQKFDYRAPQAPGRPQNYGVYPYAGSFGVTSELGSHDVPARKGAHTGTDYALPNGTQVQSAYDGKVIFAGPSGDFGNTVVVQHPGRGTQTQYSHLGSIGVKIGDTLPAGAPIGLSGSSGLSTGPHLHFEENPIGSGIGYSQSTGKSGYPLGPAYPGAENDTGNPNPYQWRNTNSFDRNGDQIVARPFGTVPARDMTRQESELYFPFMENPTQSSYNMVTGLGRDPFNGNPFNSLLMRASSDIGRQSFVKTLMDTGSAANYGDIANTAQSALTSGQTSLYDDPRSLIASIKNLAANKGAGASIDQQSFYSDDLTDPNKVMTIFSDVVGPTMSPYLRRNLPTLLKQKMLQVNQERPTTDQNPFIALTRMLGY